VFRSAASPEKQFVDLALGDAVMSSGGWDTAYSLFVNPLLNGGEADSQLQCGVWQPKHLLCISSQLYWWPHQNGILASKFGTVNTPGLRASGSVSVWRFEPRGCRASARRTAGGRSPPFVPGELRQHRFLCLKPSPLW